LYAFDVSGSLPRPRRQQENIEKELLQKQHQEKQQLLLQQKLESEKIQQIEHKKKLIEQNMSCLYNIISVY